MNNIKENGFKLDLNDVYFHGFCSSERQSEILSMSEYLKLLHALVNGILSTNVRKLVLPKNYNPTSFSGTNGDDFVCITNKYINFERKKGINGVFNDFIIKQPSIIISRNVEKLELFQEIFESNWQIMNMIPKELFVGLGIPNSQLGYNDVSLLKIFKMLLENANLDLPLYDTTTEECLVETFRK